MRLDNGLELFLGCSFDPSLVHQVGNNHLLNKVARHFLGELVVGKVKLVNQLSYCLEIERFLLRVLRRIQTRCPPPSQRVHH